MTNWIDPSQYKQLGQ